MEPNPILEEAWRIKDEWAHEVQASRTLVVFLSHSSKDQAAVCAPSHSASIGERAGVRCRNLHLARRLQADGLRNNSQPSTLSPQPLGGSDWAKLHQMHSQLSTLTHQPTGAVLNKERRFIPLRFDDSPTNGSLAQFLYINWLGQEQMALTRES